MSADKSWRSLYLLGAVAALIAVAALLFDIVLASVPGWGTDTVPQTASGWFTQFAENPWLAVRNLDLLNVSVSLLTVPMYLALFGAHRRRQPGLALLGLVLAAVGAAVFATANAALPMLQLAKQYAIAGATERVFLEGAASGLLARGAHGSLGAFPGFLLSELGTLVLSVAMLEGGVFGRRTGWLGVVGAGSLIVYSVLVTFALVPASLVVALAAPGGLALIAWQMLVARGLLRLGRGEVVAGPTRLKQARAGAAA